MLNHITHTTSQHDMTPTLSQARMQVEVVNSILEHIHYRPYLILFIEYTSTQEIHFWHTDSELHAITPL